jgi:guanylate kinase
MTAGDEQCETAGLLLIVSGPSGVGKTTITRDLVQELDGVFSVSATTRPRTDADTEGVDYFFLTEAEFVKRIEGGEFLEWAEVFDCKYGTPRDFVEKQLAQNRIVVLEIDVRGAQQIKAKMPEAFGLFVLPPSEETLLRRLRDRKREDEAAIQKRFAEAKREIREAREGDTYDVFIVNDKLKDAIQQARDVVQAECKRRARG